ncbi:hypothetical protein Tco_0378483 [Tanacetum coccineum]
MPKSNKEKKPASNLKRTARISVRPCCFSNPRLSSPPYQALSSPTDYQTAPPSSLNVSPPLSPIITSGISPSKLLLTPKSSPPPLTFQTLLTSNDKLGPQAVVKIATMEIGIEAPAAFEPETNDTHEDIIKAVAEAIISISSFEER